MRPARGFTLIELVMIFVALGVIGAFLAGTYTQLPRTLEVDEVAQTAAQLAQQCSERVLARRRNPAIGYTPIASGTCAGLPALAGYAVNDVVDPAYAGAACPAPGACKRITVTVTHNAVTVAETDFLLVGYSP
jgi:type II secretory pathway pseudopilin PulG